MQQQFVELGDKVRDKVTGFTGIAVGKIDWIFGCVRWVVQPLVDKERKMTEGQNFDEPALEILEKSTVKRTHLVMPVPLRVLNAKPRQGKSRVKEAAIAPGGPIKTPTQAHISR